MTLNLRSERAFWTAILSGVAVVLVLLFFWVIPSSRALKTEQMTWDTTVMEKNALTQKADKLPSKTAMNMALEYRKALDDQAAQVSAFFHERSAMLTDSITGGGTPLPEDFKDQYILCTNQYRETLKNKMGNMEVSDLSSAFVKYPWTQPRGGLPKPAEFPDILRSYWSRRALYERFAAAHVTLLRSLRVDTIVRLDPNLNGLPFKADMDVRPDKITDTLDMILKVSRSNARWPVFRITKLTIHPQQDQKKLCNMVIEGHVLVFP